MSSALALNQTEQFQSQSSANEDLHNAEPRERLKSDLVSSPFIVWLADGGDLAWARLLSRLSPAFLLLLLVWTTVKLELKPSMQHELESVYLLLLLLTSGYSLILLALTITSASLRAIMRGDLSLTVTDFALIFSSTVGLSYLAFTHLDELNTLSVWSSLPCIILVIGLRYIAQQRILRARFSPLTSLLNKSEQIANIVVVDNEGKLALEQLPVSRVRAGQVLRLVAKDECPVDGVVISGFAATWERLNGAPAILCAKAPGERIASASSIAGGSIDVEAETSFDDAVARQFEDRILEQLFSELQTLTSRVSLLNLISAALFFAACGVAIWWQKQGLSLDHVLQIASAVLALNFFVWCWGVSSLTRVFFPQQAYKLGVMTLNSRVMDVLNSIRTLCLDFTSRVPLSDGEVVELTALDSRVEPNALWKALFQLISASHEPWRNSLCNRLVSELSVEALSSASMQNMQEWRSYRGVGLHANLDGAEFSFGNEEFLIARGVSIDPSEIRHATASDEIVWYLAVFDELVARITIDTLGAKQHAKVLHNLRDLGLSTRVVSEERSQVVDRYADRVGVELAFAHAEVDPAIYTQYLQDWNPAAVVMTQIPLPHHFAASCQMVVFDNLRWNLADNHVTLFSRDPALILNLFKLAYAQAGQVTNLRATCLVIGSVMASLAASGRGSTIFITLLCASLAWIFAFSSSLKR